MGRAFIFPAFSAIGILAAFISGLYFRGYEDILFAVSLLCLLAGLTPAVCAGLFRRVQLPGGPAPLLLLAFWLYVTVSMAWSGMPYVSLVTWLVISALPLSFFALLLTPDPEKWIQASGTALHVAITALGLWALIQVFVFGWGRAAHPFLDANKLAVVLNFGLLPMLAVAFTAEKKGLARAAAASALIIFAGLLATESRGGFLSLLPALALMLFLLRKNLRGRAWAVAGGMAAIFIVLEVISPLGTGTRLAAMADVQSDMALVSREALWTSAWDMLISAPLLGIGGLGTFFLTYGAWRTPADTGSAGQWAHNDPLQMGVEMGVAAPVLFYAFCVAFLWQALRALSRESDGGKRALIAAPLCALITLFLHAHVSYPLYVTPILIVAGVWLAALQWRTGQTKVVDAGRRPRLILAIAAFLLAAFIALPAVMSGIGTWHVKQAKQVLLDGKPTQFIALITKAENFAPASYADPKVHLSGLYIQILKAPDALMPKDEAFAMYETTRDMLAYAGAVAEPWAEVDYRVGWLYNTVRDRYEPQWREKAIAALETALRKDHRHIRAAEMLADIYEEAGEDEKALEVIKSVMPYPFTKAELEALQTRYEDLNSP